MGRTGKYLCLIGIGGSLYYVFEQLFRGFSHWSMFLLGGICVLFIYLQGSKIGWDEPLWKQILRCDIFVVSMEFMTGIVVNCMWHMNVWDYTDMPFQILGQICLPFAIIFAGLCAVGIFLSSYLACYLFGEEKPVFHVLR